MPFLPEFNPLLATKAICIECGRMMKRRLRKTSNGKIEAVVYVCQNSDKGCNYFVESDFRLTGMPQRITAQLAPVIEKFPELEG
jgi:hypothetical protein